MKLLALILAMSLSIGGLLFLADRMDGAAQDDRPLRAATDTTPPPSPPPSPSPSPSPSPLPPPPPPPVIGGFLLHPVPFTSQAPFGNWHDPVHQDGCEEASVLMAMRWVEGRGLSRQEANDAIRALWEFVRANYGDYPDLSAADTAQLIRDYYQHPPVGVAYDFGVEKIKEELAKGNVVIVPADGRRLGNPNFTGGGPPRHMILIRGYDPATSQFITNDPGTRLGEGYRYPEQVLIQAVRDYPTGKHVPVTEERRAMVIVGQRG